MSTQFVEDEFGETIWLRKIHKNRFVGETFSAEAIQGIAKVRLRDDDVLICAFPKSGTHWLWESLRMISQGKVLEDTVDKDSMMMEFFKPGELDNAPSPRFLNNHCFFDDQPADLTSGKTKVIMLYRNPKDVAVSFFYHVSQWPDHTYTGSFSHFLRRLVKGTVPFNSPFEYWKMWDKGLQDNPQIRYIPVRYEDLHKDTAGELKRISEFLDFHPDDQLLHSISKATSFDSMLEAKKKDCLRGKDGEPLMYRKGKVGDWVNYFTAEDNQWFEEIIQKELGDSKIFKFVYSLD